jgi:hypothetical protein
MKFEMDNSFLIAQKVLKEVKRLTKHTHSSMPVGTGPWRNGREQGLLLSVFRATEGKPFVTYIAIAQQANSDDVVVYVFHNMDYCSGHPRSADKLPLESWDSFRNYFKGPEAITKAAVFISIELTALLK